ncbi:hypothetical protein O181_029233 [Austropuccinia psidii MF-1]|uniref:Protein CMS1 n=1 Tax=Austropuccinia psidii MF-1 TaxID=1389203 RepID=A0A9Q3H2K2_9BASI|nr:hypothetical protein [Austropuccinia psidii MF-1]
MTTNLLNSISADALDDDQFLLDPDQSLPVDEDVFSNDIQKSEKAKKSNRKKTKKSKSALNHSLDQGNLENTGEVNSTLDSDFVSTKPNTGQSKSLKRKRKSEGNKAKAPSKKPAQTLKLEPAKPSPNESTSIGLQPPDLQFNYVCDRQRRALANLSDLELESLRLQSSWFLDVSKKPMRAHLGSWLKAEGPSDLLAALAVNTQGNGSPIALVVSSSALRVVDLCREVKSLVSMPKESGEITKLFARHFKLTEHISHLNATKISIGVGTPDRISKLLASNALKTERLKYLLLDVTWTDPKDYSLMELPDSNFKQALWKDLLGFHELIERLKIGNTKIILF